MHFLASSKSARAWLVAGLAAALVASSHAQAPAKFGPVTTIESMAVPGNVRRAAIVGRLAKSTTLQVAVSLAPSDEGALQAYVDRVNDPASPDYRRFLTPAEVGRRFGPSSARVDAVAAYLRGQGLTVDYVAPNRMTILATATVAQAERAFDTKIARFQAPPRLATDRAEFYAYTETPKLPAAFASSIVDVSGLENSTKPVPRLLSAAQTRGVYQAATLYAGGLQGQGRNLAISNFDGFRLSNVSLYYKKFGLPTPSGGVGSNIKTVVCGRAAGTGTPMGEGDLDIQMVLSVAPLCNLTIYDGTDLIPVLTREVNDNAVEVISESYGWRLSPSAATAAHNLHLSMSAQGITYLAASGDYGTDFQGYDYPNFDSEVLQVGGTVASADSANGRVSEVGWSGSGGGYSTFEASFNVLPSWQKGLGVPTQMNRRLLPDLALNAAGTDNGAYPFYFKGNLNTSFNGTSFASPILAGLLGIAEQKLDALGYFGAGPKRLGRLQDAIYAMNGRSDVFYDVVTGNNGFLPNGAESIARAGWDSVTGWGAINVEGFVNALVAGGGPGGSSSPAVAAVYTPQSVSVYSKQGVFGSGNRSSLDEDDGAYYRVKSNTLSGVGRVATVAANFGLPTASVSATVTVVATANSGTTFQLYAYNVTTGTYDLLSTSTHSGKDKTFTVEIPNLAVYRSSTGALKLIERAVRSSGSYTLGTDRFVVTAR